MKINDEVETALMLFCSGYRIMLGTAVRDGYQFHLVTNFLSLRLILSICSSELAEEVIARNPCEGVAVISGAPRLIPVSPEQIEENRRLTFRIEKLIREQTGNCPELNQWWLRAVNQNFLPPCQILTFNLCSVTSGPR